MSMPFAVNFPEDATVEILGRVTARNGSGSATGQDGEGKFLQQADVSSIEAKVYNRSNNNSLNDLGSLTVGNVILDTVDESGEVWTLDDIGYNFRHKIGTNVFTAGGSKYVIEYKITLIGGEVLFGIYEGICVPKVIQS